MALQICPNCNQKAFTWSIDDEVSDLTLWYCTHCKYSAQENEENEINCPKCNGNSYMAIVDSEKQYRYCWKCTQKAIESW